MDDFKGKVILITGSSAGLGAGTAVHFADRGARLSLTGRDEAKLKGVVSKCVQAGLKESDVLTTVGDLTDETFRNQLVTRTVDTFGQLDVLVNNAGRAVPGQLSDPGMDSYHTQFDINLTAQVALTKLAVPHLLKVKGNIVNVSSYLGFVPLTGFGAYCMTKAALNMFTKVLALVPDAVTQKSSGGSAWTTNRLKWLLKPAVYKMYGYQSWLDQDGHDSDRRYRSQSGNTGYGRGSYAGNADRGNRSLAGNTGNRGRFSTGKADRSNSSLAGNRDRFSPGNADRGDSSDDGECPQEESTSKWRIV